MLWAPFAPPEWDPDGDHDVTKPAVAPRPIAPRARGLALAYAVAQHIVLFVLVLAFTFVADDLAFVARLGIAVWLCASLAIVGALLDARRWANRLEAARWALLAAGAMMMLR
jgi:hypothetical protein